MKILRTVRELREWRKLQPTLGLVPTMGALHNGHLNLVTRSLKENDATLMSIFVNPSQFSPSEDLKTYPRTFESDVSKFHERASEVLGGATAASTRTAIFAPTVSEMYPSGIELDLTKQLGTFVEVLGCSHQLEGAIRPHFFRGVATVVTKLLNAAQPTKAYFGQKDVQQTVVVRTLVRDLLIPTDIVVCETSREPNGLAMSSRNAYLSAEEREEAAVLNKALQAAQSLFQSGTTRADELIGAVKSALAQTNVVESIEYISLNDLDGFKTMESAAHGKSVLSIAVRLHSGVRLLDNIIL